MTDARPCEVYSCGYAGRHHHHVRAGIAVPTPCRCTRPGSILTPTIPQLIDFAAAHPGKITGHTDAQLRAELGITAVRYVQLLTRAITTDEAAKHDPITTHRLRREAHTRAEARHNRTTRH